MPFMLVALPHYVNRYPKATAVKGLHTAFLLLGLAYGIDLPTTRELWASACVLPHPPVNTVRALANTPTHSSQVVAKAYT